MTLTKIFCLSQKARKLGGDKYTCKDDSQFSIYFPQTISRVQNEPVPTITVDIHTTKQNQ